jgi:hypothetical protein
VSEVFRWTIECQNVGLQSVMRDSTKCGEMLVLVQLKIRTEAIKFTLVRFGFETNYRRFDNFSVCVIIDLKISRK